MPSNVLISVFNITGVNLRAAASTTLVPIMSGKKFTMIRGWVHVTAKTGAVSVRSCEVNAATGRAGGAARIASTSIDPAIVVPGSIGFMTDVTDGSYWMQADLGTAITFTILSADVSGTTMTGNVFIEGIIE
jgi:hypothetical protein